MLHLFVTEFSLARVLVGRNAVLRAQELADHDKQRTSAHKESIFKEFGANVELDHTGRDTVSAFRTAKNCKGSVNVIVAAKGSCSFTPLYRVKFEARAAPLARLPSVGSCPRPFVGMYDFSEHRCLLEALRSSEGDNFIFLRWDFSVV